MNNIQILMNNTGSDTRPFDAYFWESARTGNPLPEEIADIFKLEVREVVDSKTGKKVLRAFVDFA